MNGETMEARYSLQYNLVTRFSVLLAFLYHLFV
jgi:hypothetical protein